MEFTPENVINAVVEFYRHEQKLNIECHDWLKNCQSSPEAWTIVWPLLDTSQILQVQFIAANILHHKVSRHFNELQPQNYSQLKENLVSAIGRYISGPNVVLTRLELTLGVFIANTIGPDWPNPLEDLGSVFQPQNFPGVPEETVVKLLIQVFGHVPEQAHSAWQQTVRKSHAHRELQSKGESMFNWLFNIIKCQQSNELVKESLKAMIPWMKMLSICEWSLLNDLLDTLVLMCRNSIIQGDTSLCELCIEMLSGIVADPNTHHYPSIVLLVLHKIIPLERSLDSVLEMQDMELASSFYGMYVSLADCHSKLVVEMCDEEANQNKSNPQNRGNVLKLIDILLRCTATPGAYPVDEIVSSITISVWYSFVEELQPKQSETLKYARLMLVFDWVYKSLAEILIKKAQYPNDLGEWTADEREQFRMYRQDVCDCLTYCFELRGWTMLNELIEAAERCLDGLEKHPTEIQNQWSHLESLLMGIRAVTENISDESDPLLVNPMGRAFTVIIRVLELNQQHRIPKLYQAALECVSTCSSMLQNFDNVVKSVIGHILEGIFYTECASSATLTLKALSRDCTKVLSALTPTILSSCKQALESGQLAQNDCIRLVYCIGKFLPYLQKDQVISAVNEIFAPSLSRLHYMVEHEPEPSLKSELIVILRILSTLCSSLDQPGGDDDSDDGMSEDSSVTNNNSCPSPGPSNSSKKPDISSQPLVSVVEQIVPVLIPLAEKWYKDEEVMETLFSILKHTISTIHDSSTIILEHGVRLVLISCRLQPNSYSLHLSRSIILMLAGNFNAQCQFLQEIHSSMLGWLKNLRENCDFIEAYFQLITFMVKYHCKILNAAGINLEPMLRIGIEILNYTEAPLLKSGVSFLQATLDKCSVLNPSLVEFYKNNGPALVKKIVLGIGFVVPRTSVPYFSELLLLFNKIFPQEYRKWLQEALAPQGFPSVHCTPEAKNTFFLKLTRERVNKRIIVDAINEFALACRNMSGSEYGAMTTKRLM